ncbi:MAG: GlxA family transcriptional regulator [Hyphomicrobiaceae bacterium]
MNTSLFMTRGIRHHREALTNRWNLANFATMTVHGSTKITQRWSTVSDWAVPVDILLFDRFSNYCLANLLEPFRAANDIARRKVFNWQTLAIDGGTVTSSSGLQIAVDATIASQRRDGLLFVVSSYGYKDLDTRATRRLLRKAAQTADTIVGLDTGAWLLAGAGLLDGRSATIHWDVADVFSEQFLATTFVQKSFVIDGDVITCGGASTTLDLAHYLISRTAGQSLSLDVGALFMQNSTRATSVAPYIPKSRKTAHALTVMQAAIEKPLTIRDIADHVATTQKQLEREFRREFAASPVQIYQHLRLASARRLLENTHLPVAEIAVRTGYQNPGAMSRAFRLQFGLSPRELRRRSENPQ